MNYPRSGRPLPLLLTVLLFGACERAMTPVVSTGMPGGTVLVRVSSTDLTRRPELKATIAGRPTLIRVIDSSRLLITVPDLDPGAADIVLLDGDRVVGKASITIEDTFARTLVFSTDGSAITMRETKRSVDPPTRNVRSGGPRLSFDLVSPQGVVVYSGSIRHPNETGGEVFNFSATTPITSIARTAPPDTVRFSIRTPTPAAGATLRFYRVPAGLDISTDEGRAQRVFVQEVQLP